jgi:hypothetical protein
MRQPQNLLSFLLANRTINSLSCVHLSTVGLYTNNMISEPSFYKAKIAFVGSITLLVDFWSSVVVRASTWNILIINIFIIEFFSS